jgi:hypothetical protein
MRPPTVGPNLSDEPAVAYGNEGALLLRWDEAEALARRLGVTWEPPNGHARADFWEQIVGGLGAELEPVLRETHIELLTDRCGEVTQSDNGRHLLVSHNGEQRLVTPFYLELFGDDDCLSHLWPEEHAVGVVLLSRSYPVWVDLDHPRGGSTRAVVCGPETSALIEQARTAISARVPEFRDAPFALVPTCY